jgi:hypothetical protein
VYLLLFSLGAYAWAWTERAALTSATGTALLCGGLAAIVVATGVAEFRQRREPGTIASDDGIEFDDAPAADTQRLGLSG